jgi:hypothetical protein
VHLNKGEFDEALKQASRASAEWARLQLQAMAFWSLDRRPESQAALERLISTAADVAAFQIAQVYAYRADRDRAFEWLERAYRQRDSGLALLKSSRVFESLVPDRRWEPFLRKLGLSDEQVKSLPPF